MRRQTLIILCLAFVLSDTAQPVKMHGRLKVVGTQLMDEHNQPYALHGMSMAMGIEPKDGYEDDPAGSKKLIETVVKAAIQSGIYVIIDWHGDHLKQEEAKTFFGEMSAKYGKYPNIIYEVFNEPAKETWPDVKAYAEAVIKVIRQNDPNNVILVGSPHWDQDVQLPAADPIKGYANIMYTMHFYAGTHTQWLRDRTDAAIKTGLPIFISESGGMEASGDGPIDYKEWQAYIDWINKNNLSWITWAVADKNETDAVLYPSAASTGHWKDSDLRESGVKIREYLRDYPSVSKGQ